MNSIILSEANTYKNIILYGLGVYGRRCFFDLKEYNGQILYAVTKASVGQKFCDNDVYSLSDLVCNNIESLVIVSVGDEKQTEMKEYAKSLGFRHVFAPRIQLNDYDYMSDWQSLDLKREIAEWYEVYTGKTIDILQPITYNEKIQWLKIYDSTSIKTKLSDKYLVREYIEEKIGVEYLVPICGVWNSFDEVDFDTLPESFALKCTHGSGTNEIISSKADMDVSSMKAEFEEWMSKNYAFMCGFEMHYKDIIPRIIAEKYLESDDGGDLKDYKVHVFNGKAKVIQVDIDRQHEHRRNVYTTDWSYIPVSILYPTAPEIQIERPACLDELLRLSEVLGEGFIYVRVDWYIVGDHIYFGEMTFTHGSGVEPFEPEDFNREMGRWMHLPIEEELMV